MRKKLLKELIMKVMVKFLKRIIKFVLMLENLQKLMIIVGLKKSMMMVVMLIMMRMIIIENRNLGYLLLGGSAVNLYKRLKDLFILGDGENLLKIYKT